MGRGQASVREPAADGDARVREAELGFDGHVLAHAISSDGTRVIWTSKEENSGAGHLYMRDTATGQTIQLDAAQGAPEPEKGSAQFQTASSDGSRVFFTDKQRLTADSTRRTGTVAPGKPDLYECEIAEEAGKLACHLKDLTVDHNEGEHAAVQGFLFGASEDGSSVYLVAQGVLAATKTATAKRPKRARTTSTSCTYRRRASGRRRSSPQLSGEDSPEWEGNRLADTAFLTARVSPERSLSGVHVGSEPDGIRQRRSDTAAKRDEEVYLYDAQRRRLTCVSCNPTGARPAACSTRSNPAKGSACSSTGARSGPNRHEHWLAGNIPGWTAQSLVERAVPVALSLRRRAAVLQQPR